MGPSAFGAVAANLNQPIEDGFVMHMQDAPQVPEVFLAQEALVHQGRVLPLGGGAAVDFSLQPTKKFRVL
jgi:hypothetical protein